MSDRLLSEDWVKQRWDLPDTDQDLRRLAGSEWWEWLSTKPAWRGVPDRVLALVPVMERERMRAARDQFNNNRVAKHLSGEHDQKTHGSWAGRSITSSREMVDAWKKYSREVAPPVGPVATMQGLKAAIARRITGRLADVATEDLTSAAGLGIRDTSFTREEQLRNDIERNFIRDALQGNNDEEMQVFLNEEGDLRVVPVGRVYFGERGQDMLGRSPVPAGTPEAEMLVREWAVSTMVKRWADTSNGQNARSLALQEAAATEFGVRNAAPWPTRDRESVDRVLQRDGATLQRFARAQYEETQTMLRDMGISEVMLYRGMMVDPDSDAARAAEGAPSGKGNPLVAQTRPLSSWSVDQDEAGGFASSSAGSGKVPVVLRAMIPASAILATPVTGMGSWAEKEMVTVGTGFDARILKVESWELYDE